MKMPLELTPCTEKDKQGILDILNDAILHTTALYDYQPRTLASMDGWFDAERKGGFPVLGVFDESHALLGFGSYGTFRNWPAYKYSVEHSVYIRKEERGKGLGKRILEGLIGEAERQGYHTLIGGIDSGNEASLRLHRKLGFEQSGRINQVGYKFGKWLDLVFMQKILATPSAPTES
jgi:L-amino acid N-acyltransferase